MITIEMNIQEFINEIEMIIKEFIKEENLIEQSSQVSVYLEQQMREIEKHPLVGEVRMKSFIGAVELIKRRWKCLRTQVLLEQFAEITVLKMV